jgi:TP901 family phage tail tape measure protein
MAKRIEGNEIINDSWAAKAVKQGEDLLKVLEKLEQQGKETADQLSKVAKTQSGATAKSIRDITQAVSKSNAERKKSIVIDKEKKTLEEKLKRLRSDKIQQNEELRVLISEQSRINKQLAREATGVAGAYEKESKTLIKLRKQLKDLIITEGEGSKKTQQLQQRVTQLDQKLRAADAAAGQFQRNVGNYPNAMGGAIASLKKFAGALGIVGGIQLLNRGLRNTFDIVKNFDQAQANLASVLGVSRDEMSGLTEMAKQLGATTQFTASEVSELQLEFAKLGFTQKEIEGVTEATLQLAAASGTDLGNAASITGSTIRAFGLDVSETQRVVDVMAQSFSASSLDINKFQTAMGNVAPVAASAGLSVEETTAMLGTLTDAGIDASTAGTGLRNVFLELSKTGMTFEEAMNQIRNASDKNAVSLDLFGKRGATIGTVLANSGVQIEALTERLNNAGGAAQEMADKQLDTLSGSLKLLGSAWEGYILGADGAGGVSDKLKNIIKFLADNLDTIINTILKAVVVWGSYKIAVKSATAVNDLFGKSVIKNVKGFGFWAAGISLVIMSLVEVYDRLVNVETASEKFNNVMDKANELLDVEKDKLRLVGIQLMNTNAASEERQVIINKINAEYGTTLQNLEDEAEFLRQVSLAYRDIVKQLNTKIKIQVVEEELLAATKKVRELQRTFDDLGAMDVISQAMAFGLGDSISQQLETEKQFVKDLQAEFLTLQNSAQETNKEISKFADTNIDDTNDGVDGGRKPKIDPEAEKNKKLKAFKDEEAEKIKILENSLLQQGIAVEDLNKFTLEARIKSQRDIGDKIIELDFATNKELIDHQNEYLKFVDENSTERIDVELKTIETIADAEFNLTKERIENNKNLSEAIKKTSQEITQSLEEIIKLRTDAIDREIEASNEQINKSESEVERLQEIGTAQAIASAEAEKRRIEKESAEIEDLEKKKRNLLILTTGLTRVNQLIQSGDSKPFQTTGGEISNFISQLASFYDGTELTVADSLGKTGTKDGHIVRVHDNEHIVSAKDSDRLHSNGIYKTSDIVDSALNWKNLNTSSLIMNKRNTDAQLISEIKEMRKAFNSIDFPEQYVYLDRDVFKKQNSIKTVNYSNNRI